MNLAAFDASNDIKARGAIIKEKKTIAPRLNIIRLFEIRYITIQVLLYRFTLV